MAVRLKNEVKMIVLILDYDVDFQDLQIIKDVYFILGEKMK